MAPFLLAGIFAAVAPASAATTIAATGWNQDAVLGAGETHAAHAKPLPNNYVWFAADSTVTPAVTTDGLAPSGAVTANGIDFQFQPFTGGDSNALVGNGTITLVTPGKFSEISLLGSRISGSGGNFEFNFAGGTTATVAIGSSFPNWANGASQISPNPRLTLNGTDAAFSGAMAARTFDLTNLNSIDYSDDTLVSVAISGSPSTAVFGLSGVAIPEPSSALFALMGLSGLLVRRRR